MELLKTYFVYIVSCANDHLYTGYTTDVLKRVKAHNAGKGGHYTRANRPVKLLAYWSFNSKSEALKAEKAIKRLPRAKKIALLEQNFEPS